MNQPRRSGRSLAQILAGENIVAGSRVGVVGWKYYNCPTPAFAAFRSAAIRALKASGTFITGFPAQRGTLWKKASRAL